MTLEKQTYDKMKGLLRMNLVTDVNPNYISIFQVLALVIVLCMLNNMHNHVCSSVSNIYTGNLHFRNEVNFIFASLSISLSLSRVPQTGKHCFPKMFRANKEPFCFRDKVSWGRKLGNTWEQLQNTRPQLTTIVSSVRHLLKNET